MLVYVCRGAILVVANQTLQIPSIGMFATVRSWCGVVKTDEPFGGDSGRLRIVHIEYKEDQLPNNSLLLLFLQTTNNFHSGELQGSGLNDYDYVIGQ